MRLILALAAAGAAYWFLSNRDRRYTGSTTNASDAVDDIHVFMCGTHFGWVDRKVPKTPRNPDGIESVPFRTTTRDEAGKRNVLTVADFNRFLGTVERMAAQAGVFIPEVA